MKFVKFISKNPQVFINGIGIAGGLINVATSAVKLYSALKELNESKLVEVDEIKIREIKDEATTE